MAVKRVGIKEFKDKATQLLARGEPLVIERHGKPIGFYTPVVRKDPEKRREAMARLDAAVERTAREAGLTVEELENILLEAPH
ncbi:hypothetical protein [Deinococcus aestuarii]|uniref:hypothetical protein n=1 Tax=Deinococcus aestuarii TaxID=2774531 RepID=UPI001C0BB14A|nr:hypothetical protein [Deinococcus aestuarii]